MGMHLEHRTHENSQDTLSELDKSNRRTLILKVYKKADKPLTDRMVAKILGVSDMNMVRPRISEMIDDGVLQEAGKTLDHFTKKHVTAIIIDGKATSIIVSHIITPPVTFPYHNQYRIYTQYILSMYHVSLNAIVLPISYNAGTLSSSLIGLV